MVAETVRVKPLSSPSQHPHSHTIPFPQRNPLRSPTPLSPSPLFSASHPHTPSPAPIHTPHPAQPPPYAAITPYQHCSSIVKGNIQRTRPNPPPSLPTTLTPQSALLFYSHDYHTFLPPSPNLSRFARRHTRTCTPRAIKYKSAELLLSPPPSHFFHRA